MNNNDLLETNKINLSPNNKSIPNELLFEPTKSLETKTTTLYINSKYRNRDSYQININTLNSRLLFINNHLYIILDVSHPEDINTSFQIRFTGISDEITDYLSINETDIIFNKQISFDSVYFAYKNTEKNSIEKLDLNILKGRKIAVIGPTGSGKSTFIDLLLGMLEPSLGQIRMDEDALGKDNIQSYRKNFSFVPQKIFFLEDTLKQNIVFGSSEEPEMAKLQKAIVNSHLEELIDELPSGLETNISDSNQMVSGGQKQCVGIARALYRGGEILILDEATSGMDQRLEKKIYETIFSSQFQTFICVTHKPTLLHKFDEIVVFNNGCIEAVGSFEDLKTSNKFLQSMLNQKIT